MNRAMIAGVDEAGRGPVIGPLVVAAIAIPTEDVKILSQIGVDDSKSLSSTKRSEISKIILEQKSWKHKIMSFSAEQIDRAMEHENLNSIEVNLFAKAIGGISPDLISTLILDACDVDEARFGRNVLSKINLTTKIPKIISQHKADSEHLIVGAASILAKVYRDSEIARIAKEINLDIGSGYPSDPKTIKAIPLLITNDYPNQYLRWSWSTVKKAWRKTKEREVPLRPRISKKVSGQSSLDAW
jgi:ribonuclease HII